MQERTTAGGAEQPTGSTSVAAQRKMATLSTALRLAEDVSQTKQSPWTKSMFRLYGCLLIAYMCGCLNGYDGSLMGGLNAMQTYQDYFHMCARYHRSGISAG